MTLSERELRLPRWIGGSPAQVTWPSELEGIELVWHRLNRAHDLRYFLQSEVRWAEFDARLEPSGVVVASHTPGTRGDRVLANCLADIASAERSAKIDIKEGGPVLDGVIQAAGSAKMRGRNLWFNAAAEVIGGHKGVKLIARTHPRVRLSVPVDNLAPWLLVAPDQALDLLAEIASWGVNRFSISVQTQAFQDVVAILTESGWDTNVWDVSDRTQMEDAVASRPSSITADLSVILPSPGLGRENEPDEPRRTWSSLPE